MKILLAGGSGLVGRCFLQQADARGLDLVLVGRRRTEESDREVLTDFRNPVALPEADAAVCTLGTTIARAGSREAFYAVDHDAVLTFAEAAQAAGVGHFLIVTAVGANPKAGVYYTRVKGEVERDLQVLGFERLDIAQPGLLLGARDERRPVEAILQASDRLLRHLLIGPFDRYAGISAEALAGALAALCETPAAPGTYRHGNRQLRRLAELHS